MPSLRVQDIVLAILFVVMILLPPRDPWEAGFITMLGILQLVEGRIGLLAGTPGRVTSIVLQLILGYLLIGYTGGVESPYFLVLLLPVVSAATHLALTGTLVSSIAACAAYSSFLLFVDWDQQVIEPDQVKVLALRLVLLALTAVLVNSLGEAIRTQYARYKSVAEQLAEANQSLSAAEAAMRRSERLAALGQLSAGLAHELRNPLGSIKGSADLLARSAQRDNTVAKELSEIISAEVDRTNSLVTRFLDFARPLEPKREIVDPCAVIDHAIRRVEREYPSISIVRNYSPDVPRMGLDPELMEQVFFNLLTNAAQASLPPAAITVRTREIGGNAEISIIDRGCGIPRDLMETIFNPFVTTKRDGVGLGLAIVAKIVDEHGGRMAVESEPGKGSTFRVFLPIQK